MEVEEWKWTGREWMIEPGRDWCVPRCVSAIFARPPSRAPSGCIPQGHARIQRPACWSPALWLLGPSNNHQGLAASDPDPHAHPRMEEARCLIDLQLSVYVSNSSRHFLSRLSTSMDSLTPVIDRSNT